MITSESKLKWCEIQKGPLAGHSIFMDPEGQAYQTLFINGEYDDFIFNYIEEKNLKSKIIFDIGAHVGYHSLCFAVIVGSSGKVYSFEPHPLHLDRIKKNTEGNPDLQSRIQIIPLAISNSIGTTELFCLDNLELGDSSASFIDDASTHYPKDHYKWFHPIKIDQTTIDHLVSSNTCPPPDLLKIDTEGAESLVIEGALSTIKQYKPVMLIEVHNAPNMYKLFNLLTPLGYSLRLLKEEDTRCFIAAEPPQARFPL